jgi:hypothetical protein
MAPRWTRAASAVIVVAALGWVFWPLFSGQVVLARDIVASIFPLLWQVRQSWDAGDPVFWNPMIGIGLSWLADPRWLLYHLPTWLLPGMSPVRAWSWLLFGHLVAGAAGFVLLGRRFGLRGAVALVPGLAWAISSATTSEWDTGVRLPGLACFPWAALGGIALVRGAQAGTRRICAGIAAAALPLGLVLLYGEPFVALFAGAFALAVTLIWARLGQPSDTAAPRLRRAALPAVAAAMLAVGMGAIVHVPASRLIDESSRSGGLPRDVAETWSLHPMRTLELFMPGGAPDAWYASAEEREPLARFIDERPLLDRLDLGGSVWALALIAVAGRGRAALALVATLGAALLASYGRHTPVHQLLRSIVPPLAYARYPEKYVELVGATLALLAGIGAARLSSAERPRASQLAVVILGAAVGLAALIVGLALPAGFRAALTGALPHALAAMLAIAAVALLPARLRPLAILPVVAWDLSLAARLPFEDPAVFARPSRAIRAIWADASPRNLVAPPRMYRGHSVSVATWAQLPGTYGSHAVETIHQALSVVYGLGVLPGQDTLLNPVTLRLYSDPASLRLFSIDYALLIKPSSDDAGVPAGLATLGDFFPGARFYRVTDKLPRVYLAGAVEVASAAEAEGQLRRPDVLDGSVALITPEAAPELAAALRRPGPAGPCRVLAFSNNVVKASCHADRPALAVFVEQYARGWRASVDGRPARLERANVVLRAVPVPAGDHEIVLTYQPDGLLLGGTLSMASIAALLILGVVGLRRRSNDR